MCLAGGCGLLITGITTGRISAMSTTTATRTITMPTTVMGLRQDSYAFMITPSNFFNRKVKVGKDNILLRRRTSPCLH